jgi:multisubunit Na+/H+ antiporter MnhB subunit
VRKKVLFYFIILVIVLFFSLYINNIEKIMPDDAANYYRRNFIRDTRAHNAVTAIYLNYRVYDTLFETLTLLVSVMAIIHFSRHGGGENEG